MSDPSAPTDELIRQLIKAADQLIAHCKGQRQMYNDNSFHADKWTHIAKGVELMKQEIEHYEDSGECSRHTTDNS